jgi:phosphonatase-like hydrolase
MSALFNNRINLLVCDMVGTIIKENGIVYKTIYNTLSTMGYPITEEDEKLWPGKDKFEILNTHINKYEMRSDYKIECERAKKLFIEELHNKYFEKNAVTLIDPKLPIFFEKLNLFNIKIALNTGYPEDFQKEIIDKLDLDLYIDDFVSSENFKYGRPYPYMIHRIMENNDIENVRNVAKIGDTINDMKEGKNAGCGLVIGVLSGEHSVKELKKAGADIVVNDIMDLDDDIHSLNGFFL